MGRPQTVEEYRLDAIDDRVIDHEARVRRLETMAARLFAVAWVGSMVGGAIVAVAGLLLR